MNDSQNSLGKPSLLYFFQDIKLAHSIFALPFVCSSLVFIHFEWDLKKTLLIFLCMISARSYAMGMNRYLDREWDKLNPRTRQRMIPSGKLLAKDSLFWSLIFAFLFCFCSFQLNRTAGFLSPLILIILGAYPLMKTLSWLTHWYLGMCLGLSPLAASFALTGTMSLEILWLGIAITMWTAGFDILYALQDYSFDRQFSLRSIPTRLGIRKSLILSRLCFVAMLVILIYIGLLRHSGFLYFLGIMVVGCLLVWEQWLVKASNEDAISPHIQIAFFNANACVGLSFYIFTQLDVILTR